MDDPEGSREAGGISLNGLVEKEAAFVTRVLNTEMMKKAELIAARIITGIRPNQTSEQRRKGIISYVQRLITKCFSCQVISFGSVPLKTYLPDGDIDITVRSDNPTLNDSVINRVLNVLLNEEKSENAELRVKDVRYIQAEVKIIKCLIENIVVDISFNQLGGLRTLFFLEKVDNLMNGNHLFKRSVLLTKAWCFYESRILGAHHGLISTYALEILVLYIFHVFNKKFSGPLEVLYRFLELFSKFDWENFCISLWGPVPICSIPNVAAEPPRKDSLELPLAKLFRDVCSSVKDAFPGGQENQEHFFAPKYFNVIDPLRENNNLGRSVSEGNFYRIRSAFALGAEQLAKLLNCPREDLLVNSFFRNTNGQNGRGHYHGAPDPGHIGQRYMRFFYQSSTFQGFRNYRGGGKPRGDPADHESTAQPNHVAHSSDGVLPHNKNHGLNQTSGTGNFSKVSCDLGQKSRARFCRSMLSDQNKKKLDCLRNKVHFRYHFASNNMMDSYREVPQFERQTKTPETRKSSIASGGSANENMHKYRGILENPNPRFLREDSFSSSHRPAHNLMNATTSSKGTLNDNFADCQARTMIGEQHPERFTVHLIDKDFVRTLPFSRHELVGKNQMPMHSTYGDSLCPIRSLDCGKTVVDTMRPSNESSQSSWSFNRQQYQGYLPLPVSKKFPGKVTPEKAGTSKFSRKSVPSKLSQEAGDRGHFSFKENSVRFIDHNEGRCQAQVREEPRQHKDSSHVTCSGSFSPINPKIISGNQYLARGYNDERVQGQRNREISIQTSTCLRSIPSSQAANLNNKPSSSRYYNRFPVMSNKFQKYKWQKKSEISKDISLPRGMNENELQSNDKSIYSEVSNNGQGNAPCSTIGYETKENIISYGMVALNIRMHASSCYVSAPVTSSTSMIPALKMFVDPQSDNRVDRKHEASQLQSDKETKTSFAEKIDGGKQLSRPEVSALRQDLNSTGAIHQQEFSNASKFVKDMKSMMSFEDHTSNLFKGDTHSHGRNLQQYDGLPFHPHSHVQVQPMDLKENIPSNIGSSAANMNLFNLSRPNPPHRVSYEDQNYCKSGNSRASGSYGRRDYYFDCHGNWNKILKPGIGDRNCSQTHQPSTK